MNIVYKIINKNSKKIYIGSSKEFEYRKIQHLSLLRRKKHHSIHLQRSFDKWGESSFIFEILAEFSTNDILEREQYYLNELLRANEHSLYFNKHSYNISRVAGSNTTSKCVNKYDRQGNFIEMYNSLKKAAENHNIKPQTIAAACKKSGRTAVGYQWRFKDEFIEVGNIDNQYVSVDKNGNVVEVFDSLNDIKIKTGLKTKSNILRAVNKNLTCMGYYWKVISRPV